MRIAQVAPLFESVPPKLYGGTERIVSYLTEELVSQGHDVTLFASGDSQTSARLVPCCCEALRLNRQCTDPIAHHVFMMEKVYKEAANFDIIHFHCEYLHFPISRRHSTPTVSTLHGRLDSPDLVPLYREFADMPVVSISNSQRTPLPWINWQTTVYHGLPRDLYRFHPEDGSYLAFLGRISPEKGIDRAIEIAKKADIKLRIAAKVDRADEQYYRELIRPQLDHPLIEYIGEIADHEKDEFLGNALALLAPVNWPEPFGIVLIEAMACGTPVIAFGCGSIPEIIDDSSSGLVVQSVDEAVAALDQLPLPKRRKCRQTFDRRFTSTRMAKEYLSVYARFAGELAETKTVREQPRIPSTEITL
jgi:glycosyltransferase involved in cell wall biosynthesis